MVASRAADATIWEAFGEYIAKQLRQGRGVAVPTLGQFTFTSKTVDLAVSYKNFIKVSIIFLHKGFDKSVNS